jgi:4-aminobutyrate aminotransferase-like enzyme
VIADEGLQENAAATSAYLTDRLRALRHPFLANVRSVGQFYGVEFVQDDGPATAFVADLVEAMVARGFILNKIGKGGNTLKIRPPLVFSREHADLLADALGAALGRG